MALRKAFCPNCGQPTQIDDTKDFCFCLSCGNKINVPRREQPIIEPNADVTIHEQKQRAQEVTEKQSQDVSENAFTEVLADKMKEAEFYYKLSVDRKEYSNTDGEPTYYLKGQDILVDLSQQYAADYSVWWELCKPMDFAVIMAGEESHNPCIINSSYFDKALDLAPLEKKMELIKQHDRYMEAKGKILEKIQAEQEAIAAEKEQLERATSEQKATEFAETQQVMDEALWASLASKDYSAVNNSYFQFRSPENVTIIATFRVITNVLYLSAFHIDANKNNTAYLDQSIAIHFADNGVAIKFDNKPVIVRGWDLGSNQIQIMANPEGGVIANSFALVQDADYVVGISRVAKKPIVSFNKIFI